VGRPLRTPIKQQRQRDDDGVDRGRDQEFRLFLGVSELEGTAAVAGGRKAPALYVVKGGGEGHTRRRDRWDAEGGDDRKLRNPRAHSSAFGPVGHGRDSQGSAARTSVEDDGLRGWPAARCGSRSHDGEERVARKKPRPMDAAELPRWEAG